MTPDTTIYSFGSYSSMGVSLDLLAGAHVSPEERWRLLCMCDRPPPAPQTEGAIACTWSAAGWSFLSWWDRQGPDKRRGIHSGILARGFHAPADLLRMLRDIAPDRIRVPVDLPALEAP